MGPIIDRTKENPVSTDNGIIMARHRLMRATKALVDKGVSRRTEPAHQRVRSASVVLPPDQPFKDAARDALVCVPACPTRRCDCMPSESARMSKAAGSPPASMRPPATTRRQGDRARRPSERIVKRLAEAPWNSATFFTASAWWRSRKPASASRFPAG